MRAVLASHNQKKIRELRAILSGLGVEVLSQADVGVSLEPEETGTTFAENARIKAEAVMRATGLPAIADDSGLMVDALGGAPGVYSARYGGPGLDDTGRWQLLLRNMEGQTDRACRFVCAICCCFPDGTELTAYGECPGTVAHEAHGDGGFVRPGVLAAAVWQDHGGADAGGEERDLAQGQGPAGVQGRMGGPWN